MSEQKEEAPKKLTKEEVDARKAEMTAWHKDQIPFLEIQFKYEDLITKIQVAHTERLEAEYKWIQLKAAMMENLTQEEAPRKQGPSEEAKPTMTATRTLKKEPNEDK